MMTKVKHPMKVSIKPPRGKSVATNVRALDLRAETEDEEKYLVTLGRYMRNGIWPVVDEKSFKVGDWIRWDASGMLHKTYAGKIVSERDRDYEVLDNEGVRFFVIKVDASIEAAEANARHERA